MSHATVGDGSALIGRVGRLPSTSGRTHQRVRVTWATDIGEGRTVIMGDLLYLANNAHGIGRARRQFVTVVDSALVVPIEDEPQS